MQIVLDKELKEAIDSAVKDSLHDIVREELQNIMPSLFKEIVSKDIPRVVSNEAAKMETLDAAAVQSLFGISRITLWRWTKEGKIRAIAQVGRKNLYYRKEIQTMLLKATKVLPKPQKTYTYLMLDSNTGLMKIGKSNNPGNREKTLQSEKPTIKMLAVSDEDYEKELHKTYREKRVRGEWFSLNDTDVKKIMENYNFQEVTL